MKVFTLVLLLLISACTTIDQTGIKTEIIAKCTYNSGGQAIFESTNPNYSEIIIKNRTRKYIVGKTYVLILRK